jgi:hypothetical protein
MKRRAGRETRRAGRETAVQFIPDFVGAGVGGDIGAGVGAGRLVPSGALCDGGTTAGFGSGIGVPITGG